MILGFGFTGDFLCVEFVAGLCNMYFCVFWFGGLFVCLAGLGLGGFGGFWVVCVWFLGGFWVGLRVSRLAAFGSV